MVKTINAVEVYTKMITEGGENGHEKPCKNRKGNWPPT